MLKINKISKEKFENFIKNRDDATFYQSIEWVETKNREYDILGLFDKDNLVGASVVMYLKTLKAFYIAYASRGFLFDYTNIEEFTSAIREYFSKNKKIIFFRMDPPVILRTYNKNLEKIENENSQKIINMLITNGFIHFGYNNGYETTQFRFIHRLKLTDSFENQKVDMSKSTKKNIRFTEENGVKIRKVGIEELDTAYNLFESTANRKHINNLSKTFYENILNKFGYNAIMYIAYIEKKELIKGLKSKLNEAQKEIDEINKQLVRDNVGDKLRHKKELASNAIMKYQQELKKATTYEEVTNIGSLFAIFSNNEAVALASGMDNNYRSYCPKYAMYPALIKDAINNKFKYVNFLGVKNIMDKNDPAYGVYEIKRGFGGETVEYIGEFDLPFHPLLYKIYKMKENKERK